MCAKCAVMYMIPPSETRNTVSPPVRNLKICRPTGPAPSAVWVRTSLNPPNKSKNDIFQAERIPFRLIFLRKNNYFMVNTNIGALLVPLTELAIINI